MLLKNIFLSVFILEKNIIAGLSFNFPFYLQGKSGKYLYFPVFSRLRQGVFGRHSVVPIR
jgi:hypothetical protein